MSLESDKKMKEEYLIEKIIKGKSEQELEQEIIQTIIETKDLLEVARCNFEYARLLYISNKGSSI